MEKKQGPQDTTMANTKVLTRKYLNALKEAERLRLKYMGPIIHPNDSMFGKEYRKQNTINIQEIRTDLKMAKAKTPAEAAQQIIDILGEIKYILNRINTVLKNKHIILINK